MRLLLLFIGIVSLSCKLYAQDTLVLRNGQRMVVQVKDVADDSVSVSSDNGNGKLLTRRFATTQLRRIHYKSGFVEKFKRAGGQEDKDIITFTDTKTLKGSVVEIGDSSIQLDIESSDTTIFVPLASVATIQYGSGFKESYNKLIEPPPVVTATPPPAAQPKATDPVALQPVAENANRFYSPASKEKTVAGNKELEKVPEEKGKNTHQSVAITKDKQVKTPLGIGLVIDSAFNLSRSFALFQLLAANPIIGDDQLFVPMLTDHPFADEYCITGEFKKRTALFKLFRKGKKIKEITTTHEWRDIYNSIARELVVNRVPSKRFNAIFEGGKYNFPENNLRDYLPGYQQVKVPNQATATRLNKSMNVLYSPSKDLFSDIVQAYGRFTYYQESDLFFFRNDNVPSNLKESVRKFVFPLYQTVRPSLLYLSSGMQFKNEKKYGPAMNCFMSALFSSTTLLAKPSEKALIRQVVFEEISKGYASGEVKHPYTEQLFALGADLNKVFFSSSDANTQSYQYQKGMEKILTLCSQAEEKAREIRGQKRLGGFLAALSVAGSVGAAGSLDNSVSSALLEQAVTTFTESFSQAEGASVALSEQYKDIEHMIDARSFLTDGGEQLELGKPVLAGEIYHYLTFYPDIVKPTLTNYSSDKPRLNELFTKFYSSGDKKERQKIKEDIYLAAAEMEARILNYELRNIQIPANVKNSF